MNAKCVHVLQKSAFPCNVDLIDEHSYSVAYSHQLKRVMFTLPVKGGLKNVVNGSAK